ncbi:hypothetical protein NPIL_40711 [Nephila pilipes]|uniref:Uncharacterized protein n=1 Tax=Nephila pilipes TaxID=299642 RepID=A0A8X6R0B8_NEPPI|nr:hypothetical protein NPIL_40711 [Nephila pilipes]
MQDYTAADNVRDEYPFSDFRIHENYLKGFASYEHSWQSSYSKIVSFGMECYEETTVLQRPQFPLQWCTGHNCNGNKSSGLMNHHLHYSRPPDMCSSGERRQKPFMFIASFHP